MSLPQCQGGDTPGAPTAISVLLAFFTQALLESPTHAYLSPFASDPWAQKSSLTNNISHRGGTC